MRRIAALTVALGTLAACAGGPPSDAPYEHGCEFNYRCANPG